MVAVKDFLFDVLDVAEDGVAVVGAIDMAANSSVDLHAVQRIKIGASEFAFPKFDTIPGNDETLLETMQCNELLDDVQLDPKI